MPTSAGLSHHEGGNWPDCDCSILPCPERNRMASVPDGAVGRRRAPARAGQRTERRGTPLVWPLLARRGGETADLVQILERAASVARPHLLHLPGAPSVLSGDRGVPPLRSPDTYTSTQILEPTADSTQQLAEGIRASIPVP